jgi:hypothetical protein
MEAALQYASIGWNVFPLSPGTKEPMAGSRGVLDATSDSEKIKAWWTKSPTANIGLACGSGSGVYVIDIDYDPEKDVNGYDTIKKFNPLPPTLVQVSPSGGFHALFKTEIPPANKNGFDVGIDIRSSGYYIALAPSYLRPYRKCPGGGSYRWHDGCVPGATPLAEYPEDMRPKPAGQGAVPWGQQVAPSPASPDDRVLYRAEQYLERMEPAVQGRNGHGSLFKAARAMVRGFNLPDSDAYSLLERVYNPMCDPPWNLSDQKEYNEFMHKINEARARAYDKPVGWLLDDGDFRAGLSPERDAEVQDAVDEMIRNANAKRVTISGAVNVVPVEQAIEERGELEFLSTPSGLLGRICSWINENSMKPQPLLSVGASLAFLGAIYGRKIQDATRLRTNLYCVGIGETSAGKNRALLDLRSLAVSSGAVEVVGGSSIASDSSLETRVAEEPATVFLLDEVGHLLRDITNGQNQHTAKIIQVLMQLYSSASSTYLGREYADKEKQQFIACPNLCFYGVATPARFADGLSSEQFEEGFLGRCIVFQTYTKPRKVRGKPITDPPQSICDEINYWWKMDLYPPAEEGTASDHCDDNANRPAPPAITVPIDDDAEMLYRALDDEAYEKTGSAASMWSKAEENARRIGLIYAASLNKDEPRITKECADYACRLVRYTLNAFITEVAPKIVSGEIDRKKRGILDVIKKGHAGGCTQADLSSATSNDFRNARDRQPYIDGLEEEGFIRIERIPQAAGGRGRPKTVYFWTGKEMQ